MATVPILDGFDSEKVIGWLTLDDQYILPEPCWHIGIGFRAKSVESDTRYEDDIKFGDYELVCASIVADDNFKPINVLKNKYLPGLPE